MTTGRYFIPQPFGYISSSGFRFGRNDTARRLEKITTRKLHRQQKQGGNEFQTRS